MRVCRTDPESSDDAAGYGMDEHIGDAAGHVVIEPRNVVGGRAQLAGVQLGPGAPS